jgi:hypothetical protein
VFTDIFRTNAWKSPESVSGIGSTLEQTKTLRALLPQLLTELNIKTMLDAPCGDFHWMKEIVLDLEQYIGIDIVEPMINENNRQHSRPDRKFIALNIVTDALPKSDLILCRDLFIHLRYKEILKTIENFKRSGAKYLLTTTFPHGVNKDLEFTGMFRTVNLQAKPFHFPPPFRLINEHCTEFDGQYADKSLGLWFL